VGFPNIAHQTHAAYLTPIRRIPDPFSGFFVDEQGINVSTGEHADGA
jgi:hypothetical protein